ncbi:hypothetical protein GCM10010156_73490 [Planobispora rosea]|uniref:Transposase n=1 Tax=Planobispora rosea TaxID=35762 RepID=A0A8J3S5U7_PLARO|nr:hypothetical protein GCM10010156_73490 [Planobispora rosea]GIH88856.1 hypothetical protein Pro02_72640 [Planobispora rosea]
MQLPVVEAGDVGRIGLRTALAGLPLLRAAAEADRRWQSFLRRFDLEHTFRLFKQTLGWTRPELRSPRHPWEKPAPPARPTPARVRRGFRNLRVKAALPAGAPKPGRPGPGRPSGSKNRRPTTHYDVGKTVKRDRTLTARRQRTG